MLSSSLLGLALAAFPAAVLAANYNVTVGANSKLLFDPEVIPQAAIGDTVTFTFFPKAHSVTQSSFDQPCSFLADGFDTDLTPVDANATINPMKTLVVNHTNPMWFYCKQQNPKPHCSQGMVFAINPPPEGNPKSFSAFKALAISGNATASSSSSEASYTTPPPPVWHTATATVTHDTSTWVTTYTSYEGSAQPTFAPQPVDHKIIVGDGGKFVFNPPNITAAIGDRVIFEFHPKNHTVTQSSFSAPCQPLQDTAGKAGFRSEFMKVDDNATEFPTFAITINDTAPIWGYCEQTVPVDHCGSGMVFSINAVETGPNNFATFQDLAKHINGTNTSTGGAASPTSTGGASGNKNNGVRSLHNPISLLAAMSAVFALLL